MVPRTGTGKGREGKCIFTGIFARRRRSQHVSAAKEALKNARRQEPENDGLTGAMGRVE